MRCVGVGVENGSSNFLNSAGPEVRARVIRSGGWGCLRWWSACNRTSSSSTSCSWPPAGETCCVRGHGGDFATHRGVSAALAAPAASQLPSSRCSRRWRPDGGGRIVTTVTRQPIPALYRLSHGPLRGGIDFSARGQGFWRTLPCVDCAKRAGSPLNRPIPGPLLRRGRLWPMAKRARSCVAHSEKMCSRPLEG